MMARYEQDAYGLRAEGKALTPDRLADIWIARNTQYYGDSIELPEGYRFGWSYIPHFINTRFYTYAYAFAHLASLVLYALYREQGEAFVGPYVEFLGQGGARRPGRAAAGLRHRPDRSRHVGSRPRRDGAPARARPGAVG